MIGCPSCVSTVVGNRTQDALRHYVDGALLAELVGSVTEQTADYMVVHGCQKCSACRTETFPYTDRFGGASGATDSLRGVEVEDD